MPTPRAASAPSRSTPARPVAATADTAAGHGRWLSATATDVGPNAVRPNVGAKYPRPRPSAARPYDRPNAVRPYGRGPNPGPAMEYNPKVHHRRSIRLTHYDYSLPGAYFVTVCAFGKRCVFGSVVGDQMRENACGRIVQGQWLDTVRIRPQIELDAFTVMPNHLHGILWILGPKGEHILRNTGYVIPDAVGPKSLRPFVGPDGVGPGPNAVRPYWAVGTYDLTILAGSTTRSNSSSVTKPSFSAAAFSVRSWSIA